MAERIYANENEWLEISQNLANSVQTYAMENNLRYGEALSEYLGENLGKNPEPEDTEDTEESEDTEDTEDTEE